MRPGVFFNIMLPSENNIPATIIAACGVLGHVLFNRLEPRSLRAILALLLGPPAALALALALRGTYSSAILELISSYTLYLAKFPGPTICKITRLWAWYIVWTGNQHHYSRSLHASYGTHVRTGPNHLLICDAEAISTVMGSKGFPRGARYEVGKLSGSTGSVISIIDVQEHAQRRRIWDRSLNPSAVQGYIEMLARRINQLVSILEKQNGEVDLSAWFSYFSFDFMGDLAFGGAFRMMEQGYDKDSRMDRIGGRHLEASGTIPWIKPILGLFPKTSYVRRHREFAKESVLARKAKGSTRKDIFYYLLDEEGVGSGPPNLPTLISESSLAIVAGSDTTGTALSNMFFYLISNSQALARLQAEVDSNFPSGVDTCTPTRVGDMKFLNAVINEALRLQPAVPNGVQRLLPRDGGSIISGRWVPGLTTVQVPTYTVQRDPRYFSPDPDTFRPERWIAPLKGDYKLDQSAFIPFSYGPMNCAGKNLALQELRMVTCSLLQKFEFEFAPGWDPAQWENNLLDTFILAKGALPVIVKARG